MTQAKQFEKEQNWLNAEKAYQSAKDLSIRISTPEVQSDIANQRATASYRYSLQEGLKAINDSQWQKSIDAFEKIQMVLKESPQIVPESKISEIDKLLVQSRLFLELSLARKAYENKEWKHAIDIYNEAITLMETNTTLLGQEATGNIEKINKYFFISYNIILNGYYLLFCVIYC